MRKLLPLLAVSMFSLGVPGLLAQSTTSEPPKAVAPNAAPSSTPQNTPTPPAATPAPSAATTTPLNAKDLQGLDVFASGGQQLGKVTKVNTSADGMVKDVEVKSAGFLGMFKTTYLVPADKVAKKGGRVELSMTSDQAKLLTR
jgi:sporulation protein YlmC with PRC-barrel domain